jgi:TPP-dependent pyruvate/acetoin dehydrogenase alpha subunit
MTRVRVRDNSSDRGASCEEGGCLSITHESILAGGRYRDVCIAGIDQAVLLRLYRFMVRLRAVEECIAREYHPADEMACPVHLCIGQEAMSAALSQVLTPDDYLFSHHRGHGYYLAKHAPLKALLAELHGRQTGANGGKAGSQDISMKESRFFSGAIVAGSVGIAVGAGLALKLSGGSRSIAVAGFGEAAADEGVFWEAVNYAALKQLPVLFVCENNKYSVFSPQTNRHVKDNLSEKVSAFGVTSRDLFGNDVALVYKTLVDVRESMAAGGGPFFLQAYTYRLNSHVGPEDDSYVGYRTATEEEFWRQNCPIALLEERMIAEGILDLSMKERILAEVNSEIAEAFAYARSSPFPAEPDWNTLNESPLSPLADRLLAEADKHEFDGSQDEAIPGPY